MKTDFDLIIIGGGMVGASLARALSGCGLEVAVVEAWSLDSQEQPSYDDRAIALAYGTRQILQGIGVWDALRPDAEPIRHIHVSDRGHFGFTRLDHKDYGLEALGYVATGHALGSVLLKGLSELPSVHLFCPAQLSAFEVEEDNVSVKLSMDGEAHQLTARLLVAADGTRSMVRETLGIEVREWGYGQTALISNLTPGIEPSGVAYERFTDAGPMAMLPLTEGRYGMVWTLADEDVDRVMALSDEEFLSQVQQGFGSRLGIFQKAGRRSCYPLKLLQAKEHVRPRVALIGNAAHAVHPITGQGFNLGIRDVAVLADLLVDAAKEGADIGSMQVLETYADWRRRDQQAVALMTDGLVRMFTNPLLPVRVARNLGMLALDLAPSVKQMVTRQFMGLNGNLPRLSRGLPLE
ncbi:2-octaprenyl-6-methoxyphenyl hydroxylase [Solemya velesiana gill symbiont]|uniref:2-octaprenyl-6-methoxyphenyl hydroxylase n=1 Tax=Solemya velesiana gill symbiont TaxID=1918948 RepID=A0A1T2KUI1_9GAMM|nr:2-octaprenyl-6-methoxyphenyl hydroxylase [Solemya velesiana gill symbiont]OOZ36523.1 2-octaprenyl-6-methoxyphenyl hydroxylase [Solemya velesiana gill symbiont]